ncbi:MAG TPA: hypothetical protein VNR66_10450 [Solirubrobacteraceae bacterium]|nr:hypothetical protein [Solirubrobacteraceae bacterium]
MAALGVPASAPGATTPAVPIQSTGPAPSLPAFIGRAAIARPVTGVTAPWQDPFLAIDPRNSVHGDAWQSDNYTRLSGPLGQRLQTLSTAIGRDCTTTTTRASRSDATPARAGRRSTSGIGGSVALRDG